MMWHMVNIVPLEVQHLNAVAQLHMMHLHTAYHGFVGRQLLVRYYAALSNTRAACGYTAIDREFVVGFVCGVWDTTEIRAVLLKRHLLSLLLWGTVQILSQPSTLGQWADRLKPTYIFENNREAISHYGYELRPIVVDPRYRGTGIAKQLVQQLIQDAVSANSSACSYTLTIIMVPQMLSIAK